MSDSWVITPRTSYSAMLAPLPLGGASGDRPARPCTSPTESRATACTVRVQVAVSPSASVAVTVTAYEPAGRPVAVSVAVAVPPSPASGSTEVRLIEPLSGAGLTSVTARSATSASVTVTWRVAVPPASTVSVPPQTSAAGCAKVSRLVGAASAAGGATPTVATETAVVAANTANLRRGRIRPPRSAGGN